MNQHIHASDSYYFLSNGQDEKHLKCMSVTDPQLFFRYVTYVKTINGDLMEDLTFR